MANFNTKFNSEKQDWVTPQSFFNKLNESFNFTVDLAADKTNAKCEKFYSVEDDALTKDWIGVCWINPPYGSSKRYALKNWVIKAFNESRKHGSTIVMLIPARTNTEWFHEYCMKANKLFFVKGRLKFSNAPHGLPQPLVVVVFAPKNDPDSLAEMSSISVDNRQDERCPFG